MSKLYPYSCECGSVFMTEPLLAAHKRANACKPNKQYTLTLTVRERKRPSAKELCPECDGKGFRESRDPKRSGKRYIPCSLRCRAESAYDQFVADCWFGTVDHRRSDDVQHEGRNAHREAVS